MKLSERSSLEKVFFFIVVFTAGLCSIIYELLISTTSSYFLGDSVKMFSLTIGVYMAAMGVGSYFTKFFEKDLLANFITIEVILGLIGGLSVPILYLAVNEVSTFQYQTIMLTITALIGILTGFEIPIFIRLLESNLSLKSNVAYVLSFDYIGALAATLLFPFLLLPFVGTFKTSLIFGLVNVLLGLMVWWYFKKQLSPRRRAGLFFRIFFAIVVFAGLFIGSSQLLKTWEDNFFTSRIIYSKQTPYQHLVLTQNKEDVRLYINRIIQFSSIDEYRYHEALAAMPLSLAPYKKSVLILGGGEGLLAREVLKFEEVEKITVVDLDPTMFEIAKDHPAVRKVNQDAMRHPKVNLVADDAMKFLQESNEFFDVIISDLPDPSHESIARLYSDSFFKLAKNRLSRFGIFATQATSPFHSRNSFWCIHETLSKPLFNNVLPYHVYVPSFGDWGFIIASDQTLNADSIKLEHTYKYLEPSIVPRLFYFEKDIDKPDGLKINKLDQPALLEYYLEDWNKWSKEQIN